MSLTGFDLGFSPVFDSKILLRLITIFIRVFIDFLCYVLYLPPTKLDYPIQQTGFVGDREMSIPCWATAFLVVFIIFVEVADSAMGRRFLVRLEQQMLEILSADRRAVTTSLIGMLLISIPVAAQGPRAQPAVTPSADTDQQISPAVQKQLEAMQKANDAMQKRIEQLEAEVNSRNAQGQPSADVAYGSVPVHSIVEQASGAQAPTAVNALQASAPATKGKPDPFSYADWTWLNGNSREKEKPWDSKFFTPEIRFDTNYVFDFNHPRDDTMGGSTEIFRSNEVQLEQLSFGGDLHWENVRGRILTLNGLFAVTTPRNDASTARGQWSLAGAYRYISEGWGGYHFNLNHGLNIDAGIFVSYIGLFSYYNFDNWAYQPSFVSS